MRRVVAAALAMGAAWAAVAPAGAAGQQEDSTRVRVLERLQRLGRPPGADTLVLAGDSLDPEGLRVLADREPRRPAAAGDTVMARLLELPGYAPTQYEARAASFDVERRVLVLRGDSAGTATILRDGNELVAEDTIVFVEPDNRMRAYGRPTFTPAQGGGDPVSSRVLVIDTEGRAASALGAETTYNQGGTAWRVTGDLPRVEADVVYGHEADFTSCELEEPHYHFRTGELKIVQGNILVARDVRLYFADVPVFWLPFIAQSLSSGRQSGILTPRFSVNDIVRTSGGYRRRVSNVGFYWAMSDYTDLILALDWFDDTFTAVTAGFRFNWLRQFLDGGVNARRYFRASGSQETTLDGNFGWVASERTSVNGSGSYSTSTDFVRENSFDPLEVTREIRSQGGASHRFDWGSLTVNADRTQSLSDDRVSYTFPRMALSLKTVTLFRAVPARARWFNNVTWSGSASFGRSGVDLTPASDSLLGLADFDTRRLDARASHSFNVGNVSLSQSLSLDRNSIYDVLLDTATFHPARFEREGMGAFLGVDGRRELARLAGAAEDLVDVNRSTLSWQTSVSYQQTLVGSTTLSPRVSLSQEYLRHDTLALAQSFVGGPRRVDFGATLRGDVYGFFPGVGSFEAIRHKVSPSFTFTWAPEVTPTALQESVFGSRAIRPRKVLSLSLNQTFEAKREVPDSADAVPGTEGGGRDAPPFGPPDSLAAPVDSATAPAPGGVAAAEGGDGLRVRPQAPIVNLLSLNTSMVTYDFVAADEEEDFLAGFQTTRLRNQISSDFLRGLSVSMEHDLFGRRAVGDGVLAEGEVPDSVRTFDPHLSQLNVGFSLNARSAIFRWLGLSGDETGDGALEDEEDVTVDEPFPGPGALSETSIIAPTGSRDASATGGDARDPAGTRTSGLDWRASFSYALNRPRADLPLPTQTLNFNVNLNPTELWEMSWRSSYDIERGEFNDHSVRLTRDLHRWQAHFDFFKTATGNWTFRFEVSLLDNRDLKLDYKQQSSDRVSR